MSSFSRRLRPPSYVGRVERSIRGYLKDRPPDEVYATILTVGGLRDKRRGFGKQRDTMLEEQLLINAARRNMSDGRTIWHTSLSAGPPMRPLGREELKLLVENLPDLHDIWAKTAEATILERGIVDRPERIKKNSLVLLDLIKEDGRDEMEGWESGRTGVDAAADGSEVIDAGAVSD
ncbi:hypothetical protein DID88_003964 [Monilinia fructigena]|uniref:Uncharacterized protein n=1 Tax=Monilinia fructigena TaxID=38457 RepID=A0A395IFB2_9HELO|nr:hypothetical protein DID88_003964 [Monilinia fructigena]